jgi:hypothetical protein
MIAKFGIDFGPLPRLITVRKVSAAHEGSVHTDNASKVATLLLYLHHGPPRRAVPAAYSQPLRRKYQSGSTAESAISASENG